MNPDYSVYGIIDMYDIKTPSSVCVRLIIIDVCDWTEVVFLDMVCVCVCARE